MQVAQGDGQGIGGVTGLGGGAEPQLEADHFLNLLFAAAAVIGHPLLNLGGGIFVGRYPPLGGSQDGHCLGPANGQGRLGITGDEGLLDGHDIGLIAGDNLAQGTIQIAQTLPDGGALPGVQSAVVYGLYFIAHAINHSVTHGYRSRVNT